MNLYLIRFNHPLARKQTLGSYPSVLDKQPLLFSETDPVVALTNHDLLQINIVIRTTIFRVLITWRKLLSLLGTTLHYT